MDCQMPVMDGFEATLRLRGLEDKNSDVGEPDEWHSLSFSQAIRNIPIVAVTASAIKGDKERCREVGMNDWLTKPLAFGSLQRMLDKWIETEIVSKDPSWSVQLYISTLYKHHFWCYRTSDTTIHYKPLGQKIVVENSNTFSATATNYLRECVCTAQPGIFVKMHSDIMTRD